MTLPRRTARGWDRRTDRRRGAARDRAAVGSGPIRAASRDRRAACHRADLGGDRLAGDRAALRRLVEVWPSPSARLGRIGRARLQPGRRARGGAHASWIGIPELFEGALAPQGFAVRGDLARLADDLPAAVEAYRRALATGANERVRRFLARRLAELGG